MPIPDFQFSTSLRGYPLTFVSTYGLFSPQEVDSGSRLLIDQLEVKGAQTMLDLGCGYGPVGIAMAKLNPSGTVYFVDRDFVAVDYAGRNCQLNAVTNFKALLSNGFSHLAGLQFNYIASNLPSHVSNEMLRHIFTEARERLVPNGTFCVVTVSKLKNFLKRNFQEVFGNYAEVAKGGKHTISSAIRAA